MSWTDKYLPLPSRDGRTALLKVSYEKRFVDTSSNKPSSHVDAENLWLNVRRQGLGPKDKVRVVVTTNDTFEPNSNCNFSCGSFSQQTRIIDLKFAEDGRFTAPVDSMRISGKDYSGREVIDTQFGIVVNGEWLKAPDGKDAHANLDE